MKRFIVISTLGVMTVLLQFCNTPQNNQEEEKKEIEIPEVQVVEPKEKRVSILNDNLEKLTFSFGFEQMHPDPVIRNLNLPGSWTKYGADDLYGKVIRTLRFQPVTRAAEIRYGNLPEDMLLAMLMEESTGMDLLPNAGDDGGIGLIHQQPLLAHKFSLNTYGDCKELVCKKHGKELRTIMEENDFDRKRLIEYDDRIHPIKNIDAAARMIACYTQMQVMEDLGPMRSAIKRYAGKWNYKQYWKDVITNMAYLQDPLFLEKVEKRFNELNPNLTINGKKADFDDYIQVSQQQNYNYGLVEYEKLQKYNILHCDGGVSIYELYVTPRMEELRREQAKQEQKEKEKKAKEAAKAAKKKKA